MALPRDVVERVVATYLRMEENHRCWFVPEQQTGHRVCPWCNACENPACTVVASKNDWDGSNRGED